MVNKKNWKGTLVELPLVVALVFGMAAVGCFAQSNNSGIDGIWYISDEEVIFKFEKGILLVFDDDGEYYEEMSYTIKGNTLILDDDDEFKFSIKGNTLTLSIDGETMTGTKINESQSPVGRWVPERGQRAPSGFPDKMELTNGGTGIGDGMGLKWKVEGCRITLDSGILGAYAYYYIIYNSKLTLTNDDDSVIYIKGR